MKVKVISIFEKEKDPNGVYINTTSSSESTRDFSPFILGPCDLYDGHRGLNMENSWQYSKVYPQYADTDGNPTPAYFEWAKAGWENPKAVRYPMGKGKVPLYSWWDGQKLGYIDARKKIYIPLYAEAVKKTEGFKRLKDTFDDLPHFNNTTLYLKDYDAYRHEDLGMTLNDVLHNPKKKMGHAFVLMWLLTGEHLDL